MEKEKKQICASLIMNNPDMIEFLEETFCPDRSKVRAELEKNIVALSDEDYGKAMKVLVAQEIHFHTAMADIKGLVPPTGKQGATAPK
mgnify:CR=1 FL=1